MNKLTIITATAAAAAFFGAGLASAQFGDLPVCAFNPAVAVLGDSSCGMANLQCICDSSSLVSALESAVRAACTDPADVASGLAAAESLCAPYGGGAVASLAASATTPSSPSLTAGAGLGDPYSAMSGSGPASSGPKPSASTAPANNGAGGGSSSSSSSYHSPSASRGTAYYSAGNQTTMTGTHAASSSTGGSGSHNRTSTSPLMPTTTAAVGPAISSAAAASSQAAATPGLVPAPHRLALLAGLLAILGAAAVAM